MVEKWNKIQLVGYYIPFANTIVSNIAVVSNSVSLDVFHMHVFGDIHGTEHANYSGRGQPKVSFQIVSFLKKLTVRLAH